jgi:hypothetical protein
VKSSEDSGANHESVILATAESSAVNRFEVRDSFRLTSSVSSAGRPWIAVTASPTATSHAAPSIRDTTMTCPSVANRTP